MASLIFAHAKTIRRKVKDTLKLHDELHGSNYDRDAVSASVLEAHRAEFREILKIAQLLHADYQEITQQSAINWYFITVRPKPGTKFIDFYELVYKYVNRAFMIEYTLTFEQKSELGTGDGFHCHIVANTKHRSKAECLRDTTSTFNKVCADNCIDVKTTKNPDDIINNYMIEYKSDDDHKIVTKEGDKIWRTNMLLCDIYKNELMPVQEIMHKLPGWQRATVALSSSPVTVQDSTIVVQLD